MRTKLTPRKKNRSDADVARYEEHSNKVRDMLAPYRARALDQMPYGDGTATVYVLYNPSMDAPGERHSLRGIVTVLITGDGSTMFCYGEDIVRQHGHKDLCNTWEDTAVMLSRLVPDRPAYDPTCIFCDTGEEPGHEH